MNQEMLNAKFEEVAQRSWEPIKIGYEAAIIGPLLYAPDTDLARENPRRVAIYAPNNYRETMQQVAECRERGAVSVHIHPIEEGTGIHTKKPELYAKNARGAREGVPGIVVNNDASLNGVRLSKECSLTQYLETRLAGLVNSCPPDVFTLFATNEALMVADTPGGFPRHYVEAFIREAGKYLEENNITALAEISQDPYGLRSVRRGLEILEQEGIRLPALSFSFLVNGTANFPVYSDKLLKYTDANGVGHEETPKERFMRVVEEAIQIKHEFQLKGPLTFGTIVPNRKDEDRGVLQHDVWDWIAEFALTHADEVREFGLVIKAGLEEWSGYQGQQVSNPDAVSIVRSYMESKKMGASPLFDTVTDIDVVRGWTLPSQEHSMTDRNHSQNGIVKELELVLT